MGASGTTCLRCNKPLRNPNSIAIGYGPKCYALVMAENSSVQMCIDEQNHSYDGKDFWFKYKDGIRITNVPRNIVKHSPTGYQWGYPGSGPADLALNILALVCGREVAERGGLYQSFKNKFIVKLPRRGGKIKRRDVIKWLKKQNIKLDKK